MEIPSRRQYPIYDYSVYNFAANIPLEGERRYFDNILTGITHLCSVMGDGVNQCDNLPFIEIVRISTNANINIGILEITGNRVSLYNSGGGNITVTTGGGNITVPGGYILKTRYNGVNWIYSITLYNLSVDNDVDINNDLTVGGMTTSLIDFNSFNANCMGRLYMLDETERPNAYVLNGGNAVAFADVDFSAYVPAGVKAVILYIQLNMIGNGVLDGIALYIRKNGSAEVDTTRLINKLVGYTNLAGGTLRDGCFAIVPCDTDGIIEYYVSDASSAVYMNILGYCLEDNAI